MGVGSRSATVTFLLTDIVGSTRLWEREPKAMASAMLVHDEIVDASVTGRDGTVVRPRGEGDSRFAVFDRATDAVMAAAAIVRELRTVDWSTSEAIDVRVGVHTGEVETRDGDFYGTAVNLCARLRGLGHPGQVLLSETSARLVRALPPDGVSVRDVGVHRLKGLQNPERVFQLCHPDLDDTFPPLASEVEDPGKDWPDRSEERIKIVGPETATASFDQRVASVRREPRRLVLGLCAAAALIGAGILIVTTHADVGTPTQTTVQAGSPGTSPDSASATPGVPELRSHGALTGHSGPVLSIAFSGVGSVLASGGSDGLVRLWNGNNGADFGTPFEASAGGVNGVAFSRDGTILATAGSDGTVRLFDAATGTPIGDPLLGHIGAATAVDFGAEPEMLASAGIDGTIRLWNPETGAAIGRPMTGHSGAVEALDFNTAGTVLASGGADKTIRLWNPTTGQPVGETLTGHTFAVTDVEFREFSTQLMSASTDGTVREWETATGQQIVGPLDATRLVDATYVYESRTHRAVHLATIGEDGFIRLWDAATGAPIQEFETRQSHGLTTIAFVNDEEDRPLIATTGGDGSVSLWGN